MGMSAHAVLAKQVGPFDPLTLTPGYWFDASDAASVTLATTAVTQWSDKSGNARHLTQGTSGNRPAYTGTQNGRNVITFDGTNDFLSRASVTASQATIVFMVLKVTANTGTACTILGGTLGTSMFITRTTGGLWNYYAGSNVNSATTNDLGVHLITARFNSSSSYLRLDGSQIATGDPGTGGWSGDAISIGAYSDGSSPMPGFFAEVIICDSTSITTGQRDNCEAYLRAKWGTP